MLLPKLILRSGAAVGVSCLVWAFARSAEPPIAATDPPQAAASSPKRYMLLTNNRVVEGTIEERPDGNLLKRKGGTIFFPKNEVAFVADSLLEIYQFKAERVPANDLSEHLKLSQWCLGEGLLAQAEAEVEHVLRLDSGNQTALRRRRFFKGRSPANYADTPAGSPDSHRTRPTDPSEIIRKWSEGNGRDLFEQYSYVEKILINRCATAGCHGSLRHPGKLRLYRRNEGQPLEQRLTARNLQAITNAIDIDDPNRSPLLYMALTVHGPLKVAPLGGVNDPLYRKLRDWVFAVSRRYYSDGTTAQRRRGNQPVPATAGFASNRQTAEQDAGSRLRAEKPVPAADDDLPAPSAGLNPAADHAPPVPRTAAKHAGSSTPPHKLKDPFDPAQFNQLPSVPKKPSEQTDTHQADRKEKEETKPQIPATIELPTGRKTEPFKAAAPPFNLRRPR